MRSQLNHGLTMSAMLEQQAALQQAVELGDRFLAKADATFLRRVLLGNVPDVDWKKLNRKATFKMAYKARSFKIQGVLKKMHQTFSINLKDAKDKEADAKAEYDKLTKSKQEQLDAARTALNKMDSENGAKGMSKQESQDEVDALKKKAWKVRSDLRAGELAAISKAIYILHNDDARDLFKKSFASQGFLQVKQTSHKAMLRRTHTAAAA